MRYDTNDIMSDTTDETTRRRALLATAGAVGVVAIAGCYSAIHEPDEGTDGDSTPVEDDEGDSNESDGGVTAPDGGENETDTGDHEEPPTDESDGSDESASDTDDTDDQEDC